MRPFRIALAAVGFALLLSSCHLRHEVAAKDTPLPVRTLTVGHDPSRAGGREYVGTVEENFTTPVAFEASGRVTAVFVREGQRVSQGQLLATLDTAAASSAYTAARATLLRAEDGYRRAKQVHDSGTLPEAKWVEIQSQLDQARSTADIARRTLDNCRLHAPVDGTVGAGLIQVGTLASPATPAVRIVNTDRLFARLDIPEVDINQISLGQHVQVRVMAATDTTLLPGRVVERGIEADLLSHSYRVRVALPTGRSQALLPGMVCRVRFADGTTPLGYEVPRQAVQLDPDGRRFVWVAEPLPDSPDTLRATRRHIHIGDMTELGVVVDSGLSVGDRVVTDGTSKLSQGSLVTVPNGYRP